MSDLTKGEVTITLAGEERTLKPELRAYSLLSTRFAGYEEINEKIAANNVPTMALIIRLGLGMKDSEAQNLMKLMFQTSILTLRNPLTEFVFRLFNNGMSPEEVLAMVEAEGESGNGGKLEHDPLGVGFDTD